MLCPNSLPSPILTKKIWHVATLNIQAGLETNKIADYLTKSWHHISPTIPSKFKNLKLICNHAKHLDVFGVQEVDPGSIRSGFKNQTYWLSEYGDFPYWSCQTNRSTGFSTTANALLSKHPLNMVEHWILPTRKSSPASRGALCVYIEDDISKEGWYCVVAHFSLNAKDRHTQASFLAERIKNYNNLL